MLAHLCHSVKKYPADDETRPLFLAPLSELFGRVIVMQLSTGIFLIFNIACAVANSTGQLLAFRLLSGLAGSAPLALGGGVLSDVWSPVDLARAMALFSLGVRPCNIPPHGTWMSKLTAYCFIATAWTNLRSNHRGIHCGKR